MASSSALHSLSGKEATAAQNIRSNQLQLISFTSHLFSSPEYHISIMSVLVYRVQHCPPTFSSGVGFGSIFTIGIKKQRAIIMHEPNQPAMKFITTLQILI